MTATAKTQETVKDRINEVCDTYIEAYNKAVAIFHEGWATKTLLHCIEWKTADIAYTSTAYYEANKVRQCFVNTGDDAMEGTCNNILKYIADERKNFRSIRISRSTNPIANEIENQQTEARVKMLFDRHGLYAELEDAIKGKD